MRVLMTTDTVGGVWTYSLDLSRELAARGVSVTLAAMGGRLAPDQRREARALDGVRVFAADYALEWMEGRWPEVERAGEWLLEIADAVGPDVVHVNGYVHAALPWRAPVLVVAHSDVLTWYEAVRGEPAPPEWDRYRREVEQGLRAAHLVAAPTAAMLAALERDYVFEADTVVIPNGGRPIAPKPKEPFVLAAGRAWDEAKNVAAVGRVAERLSWPVRIVGEGSASGRVSRRHLDDLLARASIFTLPARYEPFGLGPLEAALAGCALVLGDIASLREVWGEAAVYVPPDDDGALEAALVHLIEDASLRLGQAEAASARALEYTPERCASAYLDAYRRLGAPLEAAA